MGIEVRERYFDKNISLWSISDDEVEIWIGEACVPLSIVLPKLDDWNDTCDRRLTMPVEPKVSYSLIDNCNACGISHYHGCHSFALLFPQGSVDLHFILDPLNKQPSSEKRSDGAFSPEAETSFLGTTAEEPPKAVVPLGVSQVTEEEEEKEEEEEEKEEEEKEEEEKEEDKEEEEGGKMDSEISKVENETVKKEEKKEVIERVKTEPVAEDSVKVKDKSEEEDDEESDDGEESDNEESDYEEESEDEEEDSEEEYSEDEEEESEEESDEEEDEYDEEESLEDNQSGTSPLSNGESPPIKSPGLYWKTMQNFKMLMFLFSESAKIPSYRLSLSSQVPEQSEHPEFEFSMGMNSCMFMYLAPIP